MDRNDSGPHRSFHSARYIYPTPAPLHSPCPLPPSDVDDLGLAEGGQVQDLVLFGVGTDGSGAFSDSCPPDKGVMLRWLQASNLSFPDQGYELERAPVPDATALDWTLHLPEIAGHFSFAFHGGAAVLSSDQPLSFTSQGGGHSLDLPANGWVSVLFVGPAWWVVVRADPTSSGLMVQGFTDGQLKVSEPVGAGASLQWRTRGLDEIRLSGDGPIASIQYQPLDAARKWTHLAHVCLPVLDSGYPCAPSGASDEDVAKSRVPASVDWGARYSPAFPALDAVLVALATGATPPGTAPVAAAPSSTARAPTATIDPAGTVQLAALDPHLARAIGMLYDDDLGPGGLDGSAYAYRVTGSWRGASAAVALTSAGLRAAGLTITVDGTEFVSPPRGGDRRPGDVSAASSVIDIDATKAPRPVSALTVDLAQIGPATWEVTDSDGAVERGTWRAARKARRSVRPGSGQPIALLRVGGRLTVTGIEVEGPPVARPSILPYVVAAAAPPPPAPAWLTVDVGTPAGGGTPPRAAMRWDTATGADQFSGGTVLYQAAATQLSASPDVAQPLVPAFDPSMLLGDGASILVPPATVTGTGPMAIDAPLAEGWRAWWVRGVDLFGRASAPSSPHAQSIADAAPPPPPSILAAEYAQAGLDAQLARLLGRSAAGDAWLAGQPAVNPSSAAIITFAWTPECDQQCPDVDAFRVYCRTPAADGSWTGPAWGNAIAQLGPFPVRFTGAVSSVSTDLAALTVSAVDPIDATHARCSTDLSLDVAGALIGTEIVDAGTVYPVTGAGEGDAVILTVSHPSGAAPAPGAATLRAGTAPIRSVDTTLAVPALSSNPYRRRVAGVLLTSADPLLVLAASQGANTTTFIAASASSPPSWPVANQPLTWYPAYRIVVADNGFGPLPGPTLPDAPAQLAVTSVRRSTVRPAESSPSTPATVHAVDATPPQPPTLPDIPAGEHCAQLASAADWHGISRFTIRWTTVLGATGYQVHRAMDEAVRQADLAVHGVGAGASAHMFPAGSLPTDSGRRAAVTADLAAVDAALTGGDDVAIRAAYAAARSDAWQLIAGQDGVASAFMTLNGVPFDASTTSYEDRFDGTADAHWFFRVSSRNAGGLSSTLSAATPPICAPRTTPPQPPCGLLALAGDAAVTLRFAGSPSANIARYRVLRTHDRALATDVRDMLEQARLTPTSTSTPAAGESVPTPWGSAMAWTDTAATPGREWHYRLLAEDTWGNRSAPSAVLTARSLFPVPVAPTWLPPVRGNGTIGLSWSHPDPRMACRVERRPPGGMWRVIASGWLPRGVYQLDDTPPYLEDAWEYRLSIRDHADHGAASTPVATIAAAP